MADDRPMDNRNNYVIRKVPYSHQELTARLIALGRRKEKELSYSEGALFSTVVFSVRFTKTSEGIFYSRQQLIGIDQDNIGSDEADILGIFLHELAHGLDFARGTFDASSPHGMSFSECCEMLGFNNGTWDISPSDTLKEGSVLPDNGICTAYMDISSTRNYPSHYRYMRTCTACALSSCYAVRGFTGKRLLRCFGTEESLKDEIRIEAELKEVIDHACRTENIPASDKQYFMDGFYSRISRSIYIHSKDSRPSENYFRYNIYSKGEEYAERYLAEKKIIPKQDKLLATE